MSQGREAQPAGSVEKLPGPVLPSLVCSWSVQASTPPLCRAQACQPHLQVSEKLPAWPWSHAQGGCQGSLLSPRKGPVSSSAKPSTGLGTAQPLCPGPLSPRSQQWSYYYYFCVAYEQTEAGRDQTQEHTACKQRGAGDFSFCSINFH